MTRTARRTWSSYKWKYNSTFNNPTFKVQLDYLQWVRVPPYLNCACLPSEVQTFFPTTLSRLRRSNGKIWFAYTWVVMISTWHTKIDLFQGLTTRFGTASSLCIYIYAHDLCGVLVFTDLWLWAMVQYRKTYETLYIHISPILRTGDFLS